MAALKIASLAGLSRLKQLPHRRLNPLTGEWVLVSPHRNQRPWTGQIESRPTEAKPPYDPACYLCPGNTRAGGVRNPGYAATFVFDNDFAALLPEADAGEAVAENGLIVARGERGLCRVVCFSPRHDLTLADMSVPDLRKVVDVWTDQCRQLGARPEIGYVQVFENRGEMMGCSNPHPHGQIWATATVPGEPAREQAAQRAYLAERGACLLCDYVAFERADGERLVCENDLFTAVVPFWAVWPFETLVVPRRHHAAFEEATAAERDALADLLKRLTARYDNLFDVSFPYSMGFHQRPADGGPHPEWHFHAHFFPPLLRSATIRKFMVGFEMLGMPQRDITAESAAARLRELPETRAAR